MAQRQIQKQQEEQRIQRVRDEARKKEEMLRAANAKLQKELTAAKNGAKQLDDDEGMDDDEETEESRLERIEATQKALPYLTLQFGEDSPQVEKARGDIEDLLRANRESKPYKTHRGQLERKLDRWRRQQDRAKEEEEEMLRDIEVAQTRLNKLRATMDEREKNIAAADEELRDLLRKAIAENDTADPPPEADPSAAWATVNRTLSEMAAQPGVPPSWAAQLGGLLEQLRVAAVAIQQQAAAVPHVASSPPSSPPSSTSPPRSSSALASTPTSVTTTTATARGNCDAARTPATTAWEARALELAFAEGGSSSSSGQINVPEAGRAAAGDEQAAKPSDSAAPPPAAASPAAAAVPPLGEGGEPGSDVDDSEDEMASVMGADDLNKREGESAAQHKLRLARHLRERAARRKEERQRDGKGGRKSSDSKGKPTKPQQKSK